MNIKLKSAFWDRNGLGLVGLGTFIGYIFWFFGIAPLYAYPHTSDFMAFYTGGYLVSRVPQLYDLAQQYHYQHALGMPRPFEEMLAFYYPPFVALVFIPFTWLPYVPAFWLWTALAISAYVLALHIYAKRWPRLHRTTLLDITLGGLGFLPLFFVFIIGQNTTFTFLLLILALTAFEKQQDFLAGVWLGLLIYKPQTVFLWGLMLLFKKRWQAISSAVAVGLLLLLIATLVWGPQIWLEYVHALGQVEGGTDEFQLRVGEMTSWRGWLTKITAWPPSLVNTIAWLLSAPIILITMWNWRGAWQPQSVRFAWQILTTLCGTLLAAPHSHTQETFLLWIGALWLAKSYVSKKPLWLMLLLGNILYFLNLSSKINLAILTPALFALWIWALIQTQQTRVMARFD